MTRSKKVMRNIIVLLTLCLLYMMTSGLYFDPMQAHERSEHSAHYGPSTVVGIVEYNGDRHMLCKYENTVSCDTVQRFWHFFWRFGSSPFGFENNRSKPLNYTWCYGNHLYKVYGVINDKRILKVKVFTNHGKVYSQTKFYDGVFVLFWKSEGNYDQGLQKVTAYDGDGKVVYSEELPH
jgi:hypothetical protein